jgi:hypothetical protein
MGPSHATNIEAPHAAMKQQQGCPTDDSYEPKCPQSAIPPYPYLICTKNTVDERVRQALQGFDDCCGEGLEACTCPKNDYNKFCVCRSRNV